MLNVSKCPPEFTLENTCELVNSQFLYPMSPCSHKVWVPYSLIMHVSVEVRKQVPSELPFLFSFRFRPVNLQMCEASGDLIAMHPEICLQFIRHHHRCNTALPPLVLQTLG